MREENPGGDRLEDTMSSLTEQELAARLRVLKPAPAAWVAAAVAIPQGGLPEPEPQGSAPAPPETIVAIQRDDLS